MNVELIDMPELRVATVRHIGPYNRIAEAFARLDTMGGPELTRNPKVSMVALYHDDPETTPPDQLRSDAGLVLPEGTPLPEGLAEARIPGGRYARTEHRGGYEGLGDTWTRFMGEWLPRSGHRVGLGVPYECYRVTPMQVTKDELRTDLYLPVEG